MLELNTQVIAIVGSNKKGLNDELGKLLTSHKIDIITTDSNPNKGLGLVKVLTGDERSLNTAINNYNPMLRCERRQLTKELRKNIAIKSET